VRVRDGERKLRSESERQSEVCPNAKKHKNREEAAILGVVHCITRLLAEFLCFLIPREEKGTFFVRMYIRIYIYIYI